MWTSMGVREEKTLDRADSIFRKWVTKQLANGTVTAWLAEIRGMIVGGGCLWLQPVQPHPSDDLQQQPYLFSIYTTPGFRSKGVASRIVTEAVEWSKRKGYPRIMLHASRMGRKLYSKLGFNRTWEMGLDLTG